MEANITDSNILWKIQKISKYLQKIFSQIFSEVEKFFSRKIFFFRDIFEFPLKISAKI